MSKRPDNAQPDKKKKKDKYEKIEIKDLGKGDILLPGRKNCDCMATKHKLINNCTICGKIVCEQEGEGPCYFCGNPIYSRDNPLANQSFVSIEESKTMTQAQKKAVEHKNKLLAYDKNQVQGSNIIDDETDWYEISDNVWLSEKQRDFAIGKIKEEQAKLDEENSGIRIAYDPLLGKVVQGKSDYDPSKGLEEAKTFLGEITKSKQKYVAPKSLKLSEDQEKAHQNLSEEIRKKYQAQSEKASKNDDKESTQPRSKRVQHDDIFEEFKAAVEKKTTQSVDNSKELYDEEIFPLSMENGSCLSMHQPWASLVIYGFKRFEGRMWTSRYRGPLWIQAGSKEPTQDEIRAVETQYKELYKNVRDCPPFPERYPTGCLLGIVDLEDIVKVEDYFRYIPEDKREETGCKYLFVVRNPRRLLYPIKLPGEKQIFKVDNQDLLESAKRSLMKVRTNWYPYYANLLRGKERTPDEDLQLDSMKLEYRKEDMGMLVGGFLSTYEMTNFAENIMKVLKSEGTKYIGKNYMKTAGLSDSDQVCQKLKKFVPLMVQKRMRKDREEFEQKMNLMDFFMLDDKEKDIKIERKYSVAIVLGRGVKFSSELYKKKSTTVKNGWIAIINQEGDVNLTIEGTDKAGGDTEDAKAVMKVTENNPILVLIY